MLMSIPKDHIVILYFSEGTETSDHYHSYLWFLCFVGGDSVPFKVSQNQG